MSEIWYVNEGEGFHLVPHVFETKMEAEQYARELFPDETEDERYARIYYKEVVSYEEYEDPSDYVGMGWVDSRGRP